MLYLPLSTFRRSVAEHNGEHRVKDFSCLDQFFAMAFAQLTYRESLRDIAVNLRAQARRLHHTDFVARRFRATGWPMRTPHAHGKSTPTLRST
jgi:hypothetical protein